MPIFDQDHFTHVIPNFEFIRNDIKPLSILEIGCLERRASCWMLENMFTSSGYLCCVDTFEGNGKGLSGNLLKARWQQNVAEANQRQFNIALMEMRSSLALAEHFIDDMDSAKVYDFIYIDASHDAPDVLTDACMAWPLLRKGGWMLFDDYAGGATVKQGVDAFVSCFAPQIDKAFQNYQYGIKKA